MSDENKNDSLSFSSSLISLESGDVLPSLLTSIPCKEVDEANESESIPDSTSPRDGPTFPVVLPSPLLLSLTD